ncbi:hypothetical protein MPDQ_007438 [Monascus purpureus]|uniref:Uncharacterized protein n=1 Tax=Monascus purpureus TaxID=5098 RepID=A0A507QS06_MONPU|nr:hypothetical protein MPDQ_007438 [Monascus purpureus]
MSFKPKCDRAFENARKRLVEKDRYYEGNLAPRMSGSGDMTTNLVHSNENTGKPPQYDEKPSELEQELTAPITSSRTINDAWAT